jgi:hypothetical protein
MNWHKFSDEMPKGKSMVLAYEHDSWTGDRWMICEPDSFFSRTGKPSLLVHNSICPPIGCGKNPHWSDLPPEDDKQWNRFTDDYDSDDEVIIRLNNGKTYVGYIEYSTWCPSFNTFSKYGYRESIKLWMPLPPKPEEK